MGDTKQLVIVDYGKCFRVESLENGSKLVMHEPFDVLLHAVHLCNHKYIKMDLHSRFQDQLDEDIKKHSDTICSHLDCLRDNIVQDIEKNLLETYRAQVMLTIAAARSERRGLLLMTKSLGAATQTAAVGGTQFVGGGRSTQVSAVNSNNPADDISQWIPFYQMFLGTIEVLMEHYYRLGSLK